MATFGMVLFTIMVVAGATILGWLARLWWSGEYGAMASGHKAREPGVAIGTVAVGTAAMRLADDGSAPGGGPSDALAASGSGAALAPSPVPVRGVSGSRIDGTADGSGTSASTAARASGSRIDGGPAAASGAGASEEGTGAANRVSGSRVDGSAGTVASGEGSPGDAESGSSPAAFASDTGSPTGATRASGSRIDGGPAAASGAGASEEGTGAANRVSGSRVDGSAAPDASGAQSSGDSAARVSGSRVDGGSSAAEIAEAQAEVAALRERLGAEGAAVPSATGAGAGALDAVRSEASALRQRLFARDSARDTAAAADPAPDSAGRAGDAGPPDDLTAIKGIGPTLGAQLNESGISRYQQIADLSAADQAAMGEALGFPGRLEREDWAGQARVLAAAPDTGRSDGRKTRLGVLSDASRALGALSETEDSPALSDDEAEAMRLIESGEYVADASNRPAMLLDARPGDGIDDLKVIKGVGPKLEGLLHDLGVYRFGQIAAFSATDIAWVDSKLSFKGRIVRDRWVDQARRLATDTA